MEKKNGWHRETHRNFHKAQDSTEATTCVQWSNKDWLTVHPIGAHVTPTWHLVSLPAGGEVWLGVQNHADNMPTRLLLHVSYHLTSQDYPQNAYASQYARIPTPQLTARLHSFFERLPSVR